MIELLEAANAADLAVIYGDNALTYGELLHSAQSVAEELRRRGIDRFAIVDPDPTKVVALLAGASIAAEACVYPPTATPEAIAEFLERFDHKVLVSARPDLASLTTLTPAELTNAKRSDSVGQGGERGVGAAPVERPHLVLTTGTTGAPRAVRHDWSRLLLSKDATPSGVGERWLLGYGMNQFGGLQVLIHVLAAGATLVAAPSFQPRSGLEAIRRHRVSHVSATPTFWRFLLIELRSDDEPVPPLRQITLGGEAVPEQLLDDLSRTFPQARITQIYAANEFGKAVSVRDAMNGLPLSALKEPSHAELEIRDGELWIRSKQGMLGYYGETPISVDDWRPTGDLVEVVGDRVYFRGRDSDVINVGGVKVHPLPVEERISTVAGVEMARVFGRANRLTGAVIAVEVVARPGTDTDSIDQAIREACADLPPASQPRSIRFVDELTTTGNKVVRRDLPQEATNG